MQPTIEDADELHFTIIQFYTILVRLGRTPHCKSLFKSVREKYVKYFRNLKDDIVWSQVELSRFRIQISLVQKDPESEITPNCEQIIQRILDGNDQQAQDLLNQVLEEHDLLEQFTSMDYNDQAARDYQIPTALLTGLSQTETNQIISPANFVEPVIDQVDLGVRIDSIFELLLNQLEQANFTNYLFLADIEVYQFLDTDGSLITYCQPNENFFHSSNVTDAETFTNMFEGPLKEVRCYLAKPKQYNYFANEGRTVLMLAASYGRAGVIRKALTQAREAASSAEISVFVNKNTFTKQTALHLAVENNHTECVRMLVNAGANVNLLDRYKRTPLDYALYQDPLILLLLLQHGAVYISAIEIMIFLQTQLPTAVVKACKEFVYLPAVKENLLIYDYSPLRDVLIRHLTIFENKRRTNSLYTAAPLVLNSQSLTIFNPNFINAAAEAIHMARIKVIEINIDDFIIVLQSKPKLECLKVLISKVDWLERLVLKCSAPKKNEKEIQQQRNARDIMLLILNLQKTLEGEGVYMASLPSVEEIQNPRKRKLEEDALHNDLLKYYDVFGFDKIESLFQFRHYIWEVLDRLRLNEIRSLRKSTLANLCGGLFAYRVVHEASLDEVTLARLPAKELVDDSRLSEEDKKLLSKHQEIEKEKYEIAVRLTM